jgi:hypothetical protein
MIERLFVTKKFGTYADAFLMLGLTQLVEYALKATKQKSAIQLLDERMRYCIQFQKAVNLESIAKLVYFDPFPIVKGQKTDVKNIPKETIPFDTVEQSEARKIYRDYLLQQRGKSQRTEDTPAPPDPRTQNGVLLTSMRHDRNHNGLWQISWQLKDCYGALIASLFQGFSQENTDSEKVSGLFEQATGCKLPKIDQVRGLEGLAAREYFACWSRMVGKQWVFNGRNRRPPTDPVNSLLSFAYGLLRVQVTAAVHIAGLDPYIGYLHEVHHGQPSMVLDLMEEFQALIADNILLAALRNREIQPQDFTESLGAYQLKEKSVKTFLQAFERKMNDEFKHPVFDYRCTYRRAVELQARLLARHLQEKIPYKPGFDRLAPAIDQVCFQLPTPRKGTETKNS